jgi:hypothetical protein
VEKKQKSATKRRKEGGKEGGREGEREKERERRKKGGREGDGREGKRKGKGRREGKEKKSDSFPNQYPLDKRLQFERENAKGFGGSTEGLTTSTQPRISSTKCTHFTRWWRSGM